MSRLSWSVLDCFFLMRPLLMPPVWTIGLLGAGQSGGPWRQTVLPLALFTILTGGVYVHNQMHDVEGDRLNRKLFLLADGMVSLQTARNLFFACFAIALVGAWIYAPWFGLLTTVSAGMGYAYNAPPFRWKDRPFPGFAYNVVIYGIVVFFVGWAAATEPATAGLVHAVPYVFGVGAIYLNTTLPDIEGDRTTGKITFGVQYGFRPTAVAACLLLAAGATTGAALGDWHFAAPALACLPLYLRMTHTGKITDVAYATRMGVLALALAAVAVCPPYLVLLIVLFYGAKPYYRKRFGIAYPSFR
ncbi:MAG: UbiA family prenyltransferase [candidate division Zixibacteria bacterium]|nr:UbiA family prenyltransferase [candidate division Zixibacteria bacterium]